MTPNTTDPAALAALPERLRAESAHMRKWYGKGYANAQALMLEAASALERPEPRTPEYAKRKNDVAAWIENLVFAEKHGFAGAESQRIRRDLWNAIDELARTAPRSGDTTEGTPPNARDAQ